MMQKPIPDCEETQMASRSTQSRKVTPRQQPEQQTSRGKWTKVLTEVLVDLMVDQVHKGNKQKHSFSKKAWTSMSDDFYKKTGLPWDKEQLMNRFAVLKRQYSVVRLLCGKSVFKWDAITGHIMAKDEVWDTFIKEYPDAETVRTDGCSIYPRLCIIFSEPATNDVNNGSTKPETPCPEPLNVFKSEPMSEPEDTVNKNQELDKLQSLISQNPTGRKRGRKGVDDAIAEAILEMTAASKLRTAAMNHCNDRFSISDCVRVLDGIEGVDQQVYYAALDLFNSPYARELFLSLKVGKRLNWLYSKCSV